MELRKNNYFAQNMEAVDFPRYVTAWYKSTFLVSHQLVNYINIRKAHIIFSQK